MNIASFVLGLVSILGGSLLCFVPPILGIIFGILGRKEPENKGLGTAGIVLSAISLVLAIIGSILYFGFIAAMIAGAAAAN